MREKVLPLLFLITMFVLASVGFLMAVMPERYVLFANWWLHRTGHQRSLTVEEFGKWNQRLSGLGLFVIAILMAAVAIVKIFRFS